MSVAGTSVVCAVSEEVSVAGASVAGASAVTVVTGSTVAGVSVVTSVTGGAGLLAQAAREAPQRTAARMADIKRVLFFIMNLRKQRMNFSNPILARTVQKYNLSGTIQVFLCFR